MMNEYGAQGSDPDLHDTFAVMYTHVGDDGYDTVWGNARASFYSVTGIPNFHYDGLWDAWPIGTYESKFLTRQAVSTDVTIDLAGDEVESPTYEINAQVCVEAGGTGKTLRIYMVQVLDHWPASPTYYRNCVKQAADALGSEPDITLAPGECQEIVKTFTFDADSMNHVDDIKIIAWAQEPGSPGPKEVHQAAIMTWPFPPANALIVDLVNGVPEYIPPDVPTDISVQIEDAREAYVPGSGLLHYRYDGGEFLTSPLAPQSRGLYWATLPAPACDDTPEFYISAEGDEGTTVYSPKDAPASLYSTGVATVTTILEDDFETDLGWTVENDPSLGDGAWERAIPGVDVDRGAPPEDYDGSGYCYVTDNDFRDDVDSGPTRLISATVDLGNTWNPILRFAYWWSNDDQDGDPFDIDISNDDGATWIPVLTFSDLGYPVESWSVQDIEIAAAIDPEPLTSEMRFRFSVVDPLESASIDEGGLDAVKVFDLQCGVPGDIDGDGDVDLGDYTIFADCLAGPEVTDPPVGCQAEDFAAADVDPDDDVDLEDFGVFTILLNN